MIVEADIPVGFRREELTAGWVDMLRKMGVAPESHKQMTDAFYHLLRIESWAVGVDWNVQWDQLRVEVPLSKPLQERANIGDKVEYELGPNPRDYISTILSEILKKVTGNRVVQMYTGH